MNSLAGVEHRIQKSRHTRNSESEGILLGLDRIDNVAFGTLVEERRREHRGCFIVEKQLCRFRWRNMSDRGGRKMSDAPLSTFFTVAPTHPAVSMQASYFCFTSKESLLSGGMGCLCGMPVLWWTSALRMDSSSGTKMVRLSLQG